MDSEVVQHILDILDLKSEVSTNEINNTESVTCQPAIGHYQFYLYALIPAVAITLAFATTKTRKNLFLNVLKGRPGLIYPMDSLMRTSRLSYACSFSATTFLVYRIVFQEAKAFDDGGNATLRSFSVILSIIVYGMVFYPLFCSLAIGSVFGYALGSLYIWMLTGVEIYRLTECELPNSARTVVIIVALPAILCMLYLCVTLPIRMVMAYKQKNYFYWVHQADFTASLHDIHECYQGQYVKRLFLSSKRHFNNTNGRLVTLMLKLFHLLLYRRKRGFRYSAQMISVMLVSLLIVYMISVQLLYVAPIAFQTLIQSFWKLTFFCYEQQENSLSFSPNLFTDLRYGCIAILYALYIFKICIIVSTVLAALLAFATGFHILSSYRKNLLALYRGDHSHIPPARKSTNSSHVINCLKYAGFQVAYFITGYSFHLLISLVITFGLGCVFALFKLVGSAWFVRLLKYGWPWCFIYLFFLVASNLLSKFVFLQDRGAHLALNNRRFFFNYNFFMFFYNIFVGLASYWLRIGKAVFIGIFFLGRLDASNLPKRFEFLDPGFQAYVGFMHVEAAHTHPVLIVFVRLMLLGLQAKQNREAVRQGVKPLDGDSSHRAEGSSYIRLHAERGIQLSDIDLMEDDAQRRKRVAARFHWHVTYTLLRNPDIRVLRKSYLLAGKNSSSTRNLA